MTVVAAISEIAQKAISDNLKRGYLAEDYDGIGRTVQVILSLGSTSSVLASVASGSFGTEQVFPAGTPIYVLEYNGRLEVVSLGSKLAAGSLTIEMVPPGGFDASGGPTGDTPLIKSGSLTSPSLFANTIRPVVLVSSLPTLPDPDYPVGAIVYNTADNTLKKTEDGLTWKELIGASDIQAKSLTAGQIAAGAISATELAATIILASLIKTAETGTRIEIDINGIRAYNGTTLIVNIPTDGSPVYIDAQVQASALNVIGNATLHGTANEVTQGGVITLDASVTNPTAAPVLVQGWETIAALGTSIWGLGYDPAGGAGGATKVFWSVATGESIGEYLASTSALSRSTTPISGDFIWNVKPFGSYVWAMVSNGGTHFVRRWLKSSMAYGGFFSPVFPISPPNQPALATDGTNLFIVDADPSTGVIKWNKYDSSMVQVGSTIDTGYSGGPILDAEAGNFDFGAWRMAVAAGTSSIVTFDSAGAHQANDDFAAPTNTSGITYGDAKGDGARFWSRLDGSNPITKHTTWNWTSASATYWVAYSWYDSNATGGTHETTVGPRASIVMGKRKYLNIYNANIPTGGADEPNNRRIYMLPNATDPGVGNLKLQETANAVSTTLYTYNAAGAADPASNNFSAGTPAELKSATAGWSFKGSGLMSFGANSFPASPATNDHFYRTDLREWFVYSGSVWLSLVETAVPLYPIKFADAVNGVFLRGHAKGPMTYMAANDFFMKSFRFVTLPQVTNDGSNYWTITIYKATAAGSTTSLGSFTTASDTMGQWSEHEVSVGALISSSHVEIQIDCQKTGSPGALLILGTGYGFVTI